MVLHFLDLILGLVEKKTRFKQGLSFNISLASLIRGVMHNETKNLKKSEPCFKSGFL